MAAVTAAATLRGHRAAVVTVHGVPDEDYAGAARVLGYAGCQLSPGSRGGDGPRGAPVRGSGDDRQCGSPAAAPADGLALREAWRLAADEPLIVSVGRLVPSRTTP